MITAFTVHRLLRVLGIIVDIQTVCSSISTIVSSLSAFTTYLLAKNSSGSPTAGLLAALFCGISPVHVRNTMYDSYDYECIAICAMLVAFYLWIRALERGTLFSGLLAVVPSFYMAVCWGGYVFLINTIAVHVAVLCLLGKLSPRHQVSYCLYYTIMTLLCINIPFIKLNAVYSAEHMGSHGVFIAVNALAVFQFFSSIVPKGFALPLRAIVGSAIGTFLLLFAFLTFTVRLPALGNASANALL